MGGSVGVESERGRGSRFWIELGRGQGSTRAPFFGGGYKLSQHSPANAMSLIGWSNREAVFHKCVFQFLIMSGPNPACVLGSDLRDTGD